jgi:hypothetical protein
MELAVQAIVESRFQIQAIFGQSRTIDASRTGCLALLVQAKMPVGKNIASRTKASGNGQSQACKGLQIKLAQFWAAEWFARQ